MRSSSKAGLFLIELIIVIAFFALASAICIRLFVHSHLTSQKSNELNMAVTVSQSAAECFRAAGGDAAHILALLPGSVAEGDDIAVSYDNNWQTGGDSEKYRLSLQLDADGMMAVGRISVQEADSAEQIYSLEVQYYTGSEVR